MQKRDRLFILIASLLVVLFTYEIYMNISEEIFNKHGENPSTLVNIDKVVNSLKEAGLEPKEAKYYRVME